MFSVGICFFLNLALILIKSQRLVTCVEASGHRIENVSESNNFLGICYASTINKFCQQSLYSILSSWSELRKRLKKKSKNILLNAINRIQIHKENNVTQLHTSNSAFQYKQRPWHFYLLAKTKDTQNEH